MNRARKGPLFSLPSASLDHMAWFDWLNILLASPPSLLPFVTKNSNIHKQFTYCHGIMPVMNPDKGS